MRRPALTKRARVINWNFSEWPRSVHDLRPMAEVDSGMFEIRVRNRTQYEAFHVAPFEEARPILNLASNAIAPCGKGVRMKMTKSSGNVFLDAGFSPAEARNLRIRSQMMIALRVFIEEQQLTQADAAKRLKVTQPRISDLIRGKIGRFSIDTLVNMLTDAGLEVKMQIKPPSGSKRAA